MSFAVAIALATWLGIQTAISPCPLATNIAAVSFISKGLGSTRRVLLSGALYVLGRTLTYVTLGVLIMALLKDQLAGGSGVARTLQKYGPMAMGPVLILLGMILLDMLGMAKSLTLGGAGLQARAARGGVWWAGIIGILFALSFCPVSAGLFFLGLLPLSASMGSLVILPSVFGIGTALPVIAFAFLMAFAGQYVGKAFNRLTQIERWVRIVTGVVFILAGVYMSLTYIYGLAPPWG